MQPSFTLHLECLKGLKGGTHHLKRLKGLKAKPRLKPSAPCHLEGPAGLRGAFTLRALFGLTPKPRLTASATLHFQGPKDTKGGHPFLTAPKGFKAKLGCHLFKPFTFAFAVGPFILFAAPHTPYHVWRIVGPLARSLVRFRSHPHSLASLLAHTLT